MLTNHSGIAMAVALVAFALGSGCSPDVEGRCLELCEQAEDCEGVGSTDCAASCDDAADNVEEIGCASEAVAVYDCIEAEGVCDDDLDSLCGQELNEALAGAIDFCLENPTNDLCQDDPS